MTGDRHPTMALLGALLLTGVGVAACGEPTPGPCGAVVVCEPGERCFSDPACDAATRCARGPEAELYGRSATQAGACVATDDDGCRRSAVTCPFWGQCSAPPDGFAPGGRCPETSRRDGDYLAAHRPACAGQGTCVALHDDECASARICALEGRCTAQNGVCVATRDADCKSSELCRELGHCSLEGLACRALTIGDCAQSVACRDQGDCGIRAGACTDCRRSEWCALEGLCALGVDGCRATSDAQCRGTRACQQEKRCRVQLGRCVR
ncbi:MAG: hypothetical protein CVU56_09995 [Deltaproteobacteria bacterium HGW-Deltaproteobacteria-14]|jgi:hypothetical protein|nr:MAG: hypothetical protein CVU56_09995 [Deltaproteobacteria bacterium HGW-Deltaproteobacteria-14]